MKIKVKPGKLTGRIAVPGSKSHSIRAVAAATLADGVSVIRAPLVSEDTLAALRAAKALGAEVEQEADCWRIKGAPHGFRYDGQVIDMANSGTSLRIFSALAATADATVKFDGDASLRSRPMRPLLDALEQLGAVTDSQAGKCPLTVRGPLQGGEAVVDGTSSQFVTALLFAAPLAKREVTIRVENLNEVPYVKITLGWLEMLGIEYAAADDLTRFRVMAPQQYHPFDWTIPADFSTAAFPLLAAAVTGSELEIANLDFDDLQGDKAVFDAMERMGVKVQRGEQITRVKGGSLRALDLDLNATPDALPAMAVAAACANGSTRIFNVPQARIKETDRIDCMTRELRKMGIEVEEFADGMTIIGGKLRGAELEGYGDHRIVMALTIAALATEGETIINGAEAAAVTYPDFIADFRRLGAPIEVISD